MATTIGSLDLNAFSDLYSDSTQYFWFESNATATYGAGAHVTLVPDTTFISNPTGQNILMNTDGFSIRNGLLPMMTLDNDSLDFNVVDTTAGTYVTTATFSSTGAQIGQSSATHSIIDEKGQRFYATDGITQLANIGYDIGTSQSGTSTAPYYTFGVRGTTTTAYSSSFTYNIGDMCVYDEKVYVCKYGITTPESWNADHWVYYIGNYSHADGYYITASGYTSHAEGSNTTAIAVASHAEGRNTTASGDASHAEGRNTTASSIHSHAEGYYTTASGNQSHAEGYLTTASDSCSHAEGVVATASGDASHAEGRSTTASGDASHAQNQNTIASKNAQTSLGTYNKEDTSSTTTHPSGTASYGQYAVIIGNGTSNTARSNALTVDWNGNVIGQAMAGIIQMFAGSTPPTGWLVCDGTSYLRSDYPTLFEALGGTSSPWGLPDSTHFNVPDLRGRAPIGTNTALNNANTSARLIGDTGGNEDLIIPYHNHSVNSVSIGSSGGHSHTITNKYTSGQLASGSNAPRFRTDGNTNTTNFSSIASNTGTHTHSVPSHNTNYAGTSGNEVGANMMPYAVVNFIICTGKAY